MKPQAVTSLDMSSCSQLKTLPPQIGDMTALEKFNLVVSTDACRHEYEMQQSRQTREYMGVFILLPSLRFIRDAYRAEVFHSV